MNELTSSILTEEYECSFEKRLHQSHLPKRETYFRLIFHIHVLVPSKKMNPNCLLDFWRILKGIKKNGHHEQSDFHEMSPRVRKCYSVSWMQPHIAIHIRVYTGPWK